MKSNSGGGMSRILVGSILFAFGLAGGSAYGAKAVCPEGQTYTCQGGINGVTCWCVSGARITHGFELHIGSTVLPIGVDSEILLSARLPASSSCTIDSEVQIEELDGTVLETHEIILTRSSRYFVLKRVHDRRYVRVIVTGSAHSCPIKELQTFQLLVTSLDSMTGNPKESNRSWPTYTYISDGDSTIEKPPPILPPNRLPPGFFRDGESTSGEEPE